MSKTGKQNTWQDKLAEALKLKGQSGLSAHRRAALLTEVFEDAGWRERVAIASDDKAMAVLDEYVEDLVLSFAEMRALLKFAPDKERWGTGNLATMYREMRAEQTSSGCLSEEEKPKRKGPVAFATYESEVELRKKVELRLQTTDEELQAATKEIDRLNSIIRQLNDDLLEARTKVSMMEQVLKLQAA